MLVIDDACFVTLVIECLAERFIVLFDADHCCYDSVSIYLQLFQNKSQKGFTAKLFLSKVKTQQRERENTCTLAKMGQNGHS